MAASDFRDNFAVIVDGVVEYEVLAESFGSDPAESAASVERVGLGVLEHASKVKVALAAGCNYRGIHVLKEDITFQLRFELGRVNKLRVRIELVTLML